MLTGDKLETAISIALSSRLIARNQSIYTVPEVGGYILMILYCIISPQISSRKDVHFQLNQLRKKNDSSLVITGQALEVAHYAIDSC